MYSEIVKYLHTHFYLILLYIRLGLSMWMAHDLNPQEQQSPSVFELHVLKLCKNFGGIVCLFCAEWRAMHGAQCQLPQSTIFWMQLGLKILKYLKSSNPQILVLIQCSWYKGENSSKFSRNKHLRNNVGLS